MSTCAEGEQLTSVCAPVGGIVQVPSRPEVEHAPVNAFPPRVWHPDCAELWSAAERSVNSTHWPLL
jgi:hypothetical protein